tara:strand:- start:5912 stop:7687 length:1776 start_codon:yes stop_codon:yes gene_type:complete
MDKEYKQKLVDNIILSRGFQKDEAIYKDLQSFVSEDIANETFIAKVYAELEIFDQQTRMTTDPTMEDWLETLGAAAMRQPRANKTLGTFNKSLNATTNELLPDLASWRSTDFSKDIYKGLDIAAGVKGGKDQQKYYEWLKDKLDILQEQTGLLGVIVRPPRGEGSTIYVTEELDEYIRANSIIDDTFYPGGGFEKFRGYPGFSEPTILYKPVMAPGEEDPEMWEHDGGYIDYVTSYNKETGKVNTEDDVADSYSVALFTKLADGSVEVETQDLSRDQRVALEEEIENNPNKSMQPLGTNETTNKTIIEEYTAILEGSNQFSNFNVFGDISADYAIFKRPDLASTFDEGMTAADAMDAMRPEEILAKDIPENYFYGGTDHISGQGSSFNGTQKISWISLAPQEIKAIQVDLMQAGYLSPEQFFIEQGAWQDYTAAGMADAMGDANRNFTDIDSQIQSEKTRYFDKPPLTPKVYVNPSPEAIKAQVDSALKASGVTRKLSDAEMLAFADYYSEADRNYDKASAEYNKNLDLAERMFPSSQEITMPTTPGQALQSYVDQQFEPEIEAREQALKERNDLSYLFSTIDTMSRLASG